MLSHSHTLCFSDSLSSDTNTQQHLECMQRAISIAQFSENLGRNTERFLKVIFLGNHSMSAFVCASFAKSFVMLRR